MAYLALSETPALQALRRSHEAKGAPSCFRGSGALPRGRVLGLSVDSSRDPRCASLAEEIYDPALLLAFFTSRFFSI
jgi:hypothetical protein